MERFSVNVAPGAAAEPRYYFLDRRTGETGGFSSVFCTAAESPRYYRTLGLITHHCDLLLKFVEGGAGEGVDEGAGGGVEDLDAGGGGVGMHVEVGPERDGERFVKLMDMDVLI